MTGALVRLRGLFGPPPPPNLHLLHRFADPFDEPMRLLFEDASAGRAVIDRHGQVVRASAELQQMVGSALDLLPGTPLRLLFAEVDRETAWAEIASILRGPSGRPRPLTVQLVGTADAPLTARVTCEPLLRTGGVPEGALLSAQDVSWRSRLEAQLAQSQRLQATGQLAGAVAHDFNNLLTAIGGSADAIARRDGHDEETLLDVEAILASAERGAALVRQLLALGRKPTLQPRVLALNDVVGALTNVLHRLLGNRVRLALALEIPGQLVWADATALDQVLLNLAVNARDAMPGGGTLTMRTGQLTLRRPLLRGAETVAAGTYAMLEIEDTGTGIPLDALPHIFEPYFTTRLEAGGTGLGLSTVQAIVRRYDGFLAVESVLGRGTRMRAYLPAWQGATDQGSAAHPPDSPLQPSLPFLDPPQTPRRAILLVDDEDVVRRVAERALSRQGWHVLTATNAEAALEMLASNPPPALAAVVSDLVMPGMDGADLVRAVRLRQGRPGLPAVLVSGYVGEAVRDRMAVPGEGHTRFLAKPYDLNELAALLTELVL